MTKGETGKPTPMRDYRDAVRLLKHTSRSTNGLWYRPEHELPVQWHISVDGDHLESALWKSKGNSWGEGPAISIDQLRNPPEQFSDYALTTILKGARGKGKRAIGIVLHLHNSFQLTEIRGEYSEPGEDIASLDELVRIAPESALSGSQTDSKSFSYSLLPFWGISASGRSGVAVQTPNQYCAFVEQLTLWGESNNVPVKVAVTAAPLEALAQFRPPETEKGGESQTDGRIIIFRSRATSFITVLNGEDELCSARIIGNPQFKELPPNLKQILLNCAESENIANPAVYLFNMSGHHNPVSENTLQSEGIELVEHSPISTVPVEFCNSTNTPELFTVPESINENQTFSQLSSGWGRRNLYSLQCQDPSRFPSQGTLHILQVSRMVRAILTLAVPVAMGWSSVSAIVNSQQDYWKVKKSHVVNTTEMFRKLNGEKKRILYWENLLASRSEGWIPLAAMLDIFPEEKGIVLTDFRTNFYAMPPSKRGKRLPMRQTWRAKGYATDDGMQHLISLSSKSNLSSSFDQIAEWSEAPVYRTDGGTRSLSVTLGQKQGTMVANQVISKAMARHYRRGFEIEIERNFTDKDEIALVISPPSNLQPGAQE